MGKPTEEQRPVIENASANNMVIAAPGSGKSFTMIEAVISILKKYPYARIGMVTFTRAATNALAAKLQKRLSRILTGCWWILFTDSLRSNWT